MILPIQEHVLYHISYTYGDILAYEIVSGSEVAFDKSTSYGDLMLVLVYKIRDNEDDDWRSPEFRMAILAKSYIHDIYELERIEEIAPNIHIDDKTYSVARKIDLNA